MKMKNCYIPALAVEIRISLPFADFPVVQIRISLAIHNSPVCTSPIQRKAFPIQHKGRIKL